MTDDSRPAPEIPRSKYQGLPSELHAKIAELLPFFDLSSYARACQIINTVLKGRRTPEWAKRHNQMIKETTQLLEDWEPDKVAVLREHHCRPTNPPPPELAEFITRAELLGLERRYVDAALTLPYEGRFAWSGNQSFDPQYILRFSTETEIG